MTNNVDRFHAAVTVLAGDGHIKQRLTRAFQDSLAEIDDDELPVMIKEPFAELRQRMQSVAPLNGEGPIRASVRKMSGHEAGECAVSVVAMYREMLRHEDTVATDRQALTSEEAHHIPPFLVKSVS